MDEIGISIPIKDLIELESPLLNGNDSEQICAVSFVGKLIRNKNLLFEAISHPSIGDAAYSYQRLEWVGDAVLSLAVRSWLYRTFSCEPVGLLNSLESAIVNNSALSYLAIRHKLHHIIRHKCHDLYIAMSKFETCVDTKSMWDVPVPKVLADVSEALVGAVHLDSEWKASEESALHIISILTKVIQVTIDLGSFEETAISLMHPKQKL